MFLRRLKMAEPCHMRRQKQSQIFNFSPQILEKYLFKKHSNQPILRIALQYLLLDGNPYHNFLKNKMCLKAILKVLESSLVVIRSVFKTEPSYLIPILCLNPSILVPLKFFYLVGSNELWYKSAPCGEEAQTFLISLFHTYYILNF